MACVWTLALLGMSGCGASGSDRVCTVFAAASLSGVFEELEAAFEAAHPSIDIIVSTAGSQILASQLLEGADTDVFAPADDAQMARVDHLFTDPLVFAATRMVLITPTDRPLQHAADLAEPGLRVVLAADSVPAGRYARRVLGLLGIHDAVEQNIVSEEHDVRGVLAKVLLGEADAGFVYASDINNIDTGKLRVIEVQTDPPVRAEYPIAVHRASPDPDTARALVAFIRSDAGVAILHRHGFDTP